MSVGAAFRRRGPSFCLVIGGDGVSMNRMQALKIMVIMSVDDF